ncbi:hypothetical protein CCP3SC1_70051 [Gammaproteobacteria bacterium]
MNPLAQGAPALVPVIFRDTTLFLVEHEGQPYVPMRPVVEGMGMSWAAQTVKLNSNKERWGVSIIETPSEGGLQQHLCILLRKLPGWMANIHPNKVDPSIRPKVIAYQNECDDVLWRHWSGQRQAEPSIPAQAPVLPRVRVMFTIDNGKVVDTCQFTGDHFVLRVDELAGLVSEIGLNHVADIIQACSRRMLIATNSVVRGLK